MKVTALEWYTRYNQSIDLEESGLGLSNRVKKRHEEMTDDDIIGNVASLGITADMDFGEVKRKIFDYACSVYGGSKTVSVKKGTKASIIINFSGFVSAMNISFMPRLLIDVRSSLETIVSLDVRIDTTGSGTFHSREIEVTHGNAADIEDEIIACINNVDKLDKLPGKQWPADWSKKEFSKMFAGFNSQGYKPTVAKHDFTLNDIKKWIMLPRYWNNGYFDYTKAIQDLNCGHSVMYEIYKYAPYDPKYVRDKVKYKGIYQGKIDYFRVFFPNVINSDGYPSIMWDLGFRFKFKAFRDDQIFNEIGSHRMNVRVDEDDPDFKQKMQFIPKNSEMFEEIIDKVTHFFTSNKNTKYCKNAIEYVKSLLKEK